MPASLSPQKLPIILRRYCHRRVLGIVFCEGTREGAFFVEIPFEFKGMVHAVAEFDVVDFLLLGSPPEIDIAVQLVVRQYFAPFADHEIFPQSSNIRSQRRLFEITDNGVADADIEKVNLAVASDFIAYIAA